MQERRQLPRWQIGKQAKVKWGLAAELCSCSIEDMNLKGMRVSLPQRLPSEDSVKVQLVLTDSLQIEAEVQVAWVEEDEGRYVHGMSFNIVMDEDRDKVHRYISYYSFKQFQDRWWGK